MFDPPVARWTGSRIPAGQFATFGVRVTAPLRASVMNLGVREAWADGRSNAGFVRVLVARGAPTVAARDSGARTLGKSALFVAIPERIERILGLGGRVDRDRGVVLQCEPPVAGDVVGVGVRLEDALDAHAAALGLLEVRLDRVGRIDHDRDTRMLVADEVGAATEPLVHELTKEHGATLPARPAHFLEVMSVCSIRRG